MDFDRSLLEMIDDYISDAMAKTGTRRAPRQTLQSLGREPELDVADLEPLADLIAARMRTKPNEPQGATRTFVIDERNADPALLAQVTQQLAQSQPALEPLPRSRAPRSTSDLVEEEITNIVPRPAKR
ncbi:MAG TPA: hypothetical protein VFV99_13935 [Kofleriaceae bacterium]|nr:hypothetical protein [Kofleriaceae bacterium]